MTQYYPSTVRYVFDPEKGLVQEIGDPSTVTFASGTIVEVSGVIAYVPEDPTQWAAIPTNLVQAVDYLAAGSGSGGGGGGGGTPGGSNGDIQYKVNATTFGGVNKLTFVGGNLVGTGSFNGVFSGSLTKLADGSNYLIAGTNITLTTGSNGSVTIDGAGSIGGTIAANEVAFGIGADAISGSPSFTWNASTYELTVADPAAIETLTLKVSDPGSGVSASINTTKVLDLQIPELQLNSNPGSTGQVLTSQGPGSAPIWSTPSGGGGTISGSIEVNEVAFGTATGVVSGSTNLNYNSTTGDLTIGDGVPHSIRIGPYGYVSNPIIESLESMNINIVNFGGALGIQAANNDLVLIGGDDGGGQSYLQTQPNVRLESKGRLLVQPATDGADAVEIKDSAGTYIIQVDSTTKTVSLTGDANPVLSLVDEISATPFLQITPSTREVSMSDPSIPTNTTVISTTDVAVADGVGTGNLSAQVIGVTDIGTTNKITLSSPGGEATLKADDGAGALIELHLSASSLTMQSLVASGDFFSVDASAQRLTVVDPGTTVDLVYLEGGRLTVDAAGNTLSFDAFTVPTITTLNVGSSLPMPLNLSIEALQINTDPGSAGYVLVSSGSGAAPVWAEAPYSAAVSADWSGTPPATIKEALDRIAAALGPIA